ncbi:VOC family protein [Mucilaginibacter sp. UR6-1]|uniref:VOC family protein n=1 Tax=Mucilaginibacter sp. UR6-1 TaxID=1435643 RepID=UPI001E296CF9|nr:VOC family protein [Mucilaginibacter sp. UR6-1]MCC8409245.1 VOC family protein [Mucilaginibacter sp. UR6-1]
MKLTSLRPVLWTENINKTISFYVDVLGFIISEKNDDWGWASLDRDNVAIMLAKPNGHSSHTKISFTGSFYFNTDDVEAFWLAVKDKAPICYSIETFEWGMREFAIYDNNGYILQIGQQVAE